jgi:hypothetical protein
MDKHRGPAPCGIVCRTCRHLGEGCAGCFDGGGDAACALRACAAAKAVPGCWVCADFPCEHVQHLDPAWKGLTVGLIESLKALGEDRYVDLAFENIGEGAEYGDFRFRSPEAIRRLVAGASEAEQAGE